MPGTYLSNAFSLSMLQQFPAMIRVMEVSLEEVKEMLRQGFISAIGHQGTAELLSQLLGIQVPVNRVAIKLEKGARLIVFQLLERLPEGKVLSAEEVMKLYTEGKAKFFLVELI